MLYKKKNTKELDLELFKNPTAEYRGAPFWGWNCELEECELLRQIDIFKEMGFGGFHIHPRSGLKTEYLGEKYMDLLKKCVKKAKEEGMLAWLYDEDRWASGSAGGYVTSIKKYRERLIVFTINKKDDAEEKEKAIEEGKPYLLNIFDVVLNDDGTLKSYKAINENEKNVGRRWYAYSANPKELGWYNGNTYVDTLNPEAIEKFIEVTHEAYFKVAGVDFGDTIPAIFTDEPHHSDLDQLKLCHDTNDVTLSWTCDFDESFLKEYGFDIKERLPELLWNLENNEISYARYCYHNHLSNRFTDAFVAKTGKWCREHNIHLTGHMAEEDSLIMQTRLVGEEMRAYPHFGMPGVDMLCDKICLTTLKQAQSVVHQYGKEGMIAEHCGVTNWDFGFKEHKFHTDWLMALGVTARAHHGSWVSAKGVAKRDYPASINYHSPWYTEYSFVENHCSRLATVLSRGKPSIKVGVIHPIESMWLLFGAQESNGQAQKQLEENFQNVTKWLLFGTVDFDFISEALLENIYGGSTHGQLSVGEMKYSAVIVPECITLRSSTVEKLKEFKNNGGKLIFMGKCPEYINARCSDDIREIYDEALKVDFNYNELLKVLEEERVVRITDSCGKYTDNLIYNLREDGEVNWLFLAHAAKNSKTQEPQNIIIDIKGEYAPVLFDTVKGETKQIPFIKENGHTFIKYTLYEHDSLLLKLEKSEEKQYKADEKEKKIIGIFDISEKVDYTREEDNVYLLDMARYSLDGGRYQPCEEMRRIDEMLREKFGYPKSDGQDIQPWAMEEEETHYVDLEFDIFCECNVDKTYLAAEEIISARLNDNEIELTDSGWYFDKSIRKYSLPQIKSGQNTLLLRVPFGKSISLENMFILGDFNVKVEGTLKTIIPKTTQCAFGSITNQGMPFYGGNLTYHTEVDTTECDLIINTSGYRGSLVKVYLDGKEQGIIAYSPYELKICNVKQGKHKIDIKLFGNRYNTFAALHNCGNMTWAGPGMWYSKGNNWCYEYNLKETGIMKRPVFTAVK